MKSLYNLYWWRGAWNSNFGDVLGPAIFKHFTGQDYVESEAADSNLVLIGSIAEHLPEGYEGTIAGIGMARGSTRKDFSKAKVLAVRGELTLKRINIDSTPLLADPGLIATDLVNNLPDRQYKIGVIPHYSDKTLKAPKGGLLINLLDPIEKVIMDAASCESIVTSSLHGLILADALGVPRMWKKYSRVQGGGFKFYDYSTSISEKIAPDVWITANKDTIKYKQDKLREMLSCL
jgi:pyruvyltransferase